MNALRNLFKECWFCVVDDDINIFFFPTGLSLVPLLHTREPFKLLEIRTTLQFLTLISSPFSRFLSQSLQCTYIPFLLRQRKCFVFLLLYRSCWSSQSSNERWSATDVSHAPLAHSEWSRNRCSERILRMNHEPARVAANEHLPLSNRRAERTNKNNTARRTLRDEA